MTCGGYPDGVWEQDPRAPWNAPDPWEGHTCGACEVMSHDGIIKGVKEIHVEKPKVLDADGVEIHVGDTVCGTRDMEPMRVVDADSRECGFKHIKCGEGAE